ncbi:MAG: putative dsRNA-binding protein [Patescibacteria group bacterium]
MDEKMKNTDWVSLFGQRVAHLGLQYHYRIEEADSGGWLVVLTLEKQELTRLNCLSSRSGKQEAARQGVDWLACHAPECLGMYLAMRRRASPLFRVTHEHRPWIVEAVVTGIVMGVGYGSEKKAARAKAAEQALDHILRRDRRDSAEREKREKLGKRRAKFGRENEQRLLDILRQPTLPLPAWITGVRAATPEEDRKGIDVVVDTCDVGHIYLQVKSSVRGKFQFVSRHPVAHDTAVIIVTKTMEPLEILKEAISLCGRLHQEVLKRK